MEVLKAFIRVVTGKDKLAWYYCPLCEKLVLTSLPKDLTEYYKKRHKERPMLALCDDCRHRIERAGVSGEEVSRLVARFIYN